MLASGRNSASRSCRGKLPSHVVILVLVLVLQSFVPSAQDGTSPSQIPSQAARILFMMRKTSASSDGHFPPVLRGGTHESEEAEMSQYYTPNNSRSPSRDGDRTQNLDPKDPRRVHVGKADDREPSKELLETREYLRHGRNVPRLQFP